MRPRARTRDSTREACSSAQKQASEAGGSFAASGARRCALISRKNSSAWGSRPAASPGSTRLPAAASKRLRRRGGSKASSLGNCLSPRPQAKRENAASVPARSRPSRGCEK